MNNEKQTILQDFGLGLNTLVAPNRLDKRNSPTHSNVWYHNGAIAKRPGMGAGSARTTQFGKDWYGIAMYVTTFSNVENVIIQANLLLTDSRTILLKTSDITTVGTMNTGGTGTALTTSGSPTVTGSGTDWLTTARADAMFAIGSDIVKISTVDSNTQLTLASNFPTTNNPAVAYTITNSWPDKARVCFADMNSKVYISGITSTPVSWNGTTQVFVDAYPKAKNAIVFKNYVFVSGMVANPSRVQWSALKDPATWPSSNFVDVTPDDGFPIVGLWSDGQSILIFKTRKVFKLSGDIFDPSNPTYTLTEVYVPPDFIIYSTRSVQLFGQFGYIMLGKLGFYSYDGGGTITKILDYDRISDQYNSMTSDPTAGFVTPAQEPASALVNGDYWLQVPDRSGSLSSDKANRFIIDKTGAIWRWTATAAGIISDWAYSSGILYGVCSAQTSSTDVTKSRILSVNPLTQVNYDGVDTNGLPGAAITGTFTTKINEFAKQQRFGRVYVYFKKQSAGNLTFEYSIDEGSFSSTTIDMTAGTGTRVKSDPIIVGRIGRSIQFRCSNSVISQTFEVYAIEFYHQELRQ